MCGNFVRPSPMTAESWRRRASALGLLLFMAIMLAVTVDGGTVHAGTASRTTAANLFRLSEHHGRHHQHQTVVSTTSGHQIDDEESDDTLTKTNGGGDTLMGCKELRSKRYISDGPCTSIRPLVEVVCAGVCLPISKLPWYTDLVNLWSRPEDNKWQCVDDVIKRKRINLLCQDGMQRSYTVRTVKSCKCKKRKRVNHRPTVGNRN